MIHKQSQRGFMAAGVTKLFVVGLLSTACIMSEDRLFVPDPEFFKDAGYQFAKGVEASFTEDMITPKQQKLMLQDVGYQLAQGTGRAIHEVMPDPRAVKSLLNEGSRKIPELIKGVAEQSSQQIPVLTKIFAKDIRKAMADGTQELAGGMSDSSKVMAQEVSKIFEKDGEMDRAGQDIVGLYSRMASSATNKIVIKNGAKVAALGLTATATYCSLIYGIPMGFRMLERMWTTPKLIIASSKKSMWEKVFGRSAHKPADMIFTPSLKKRLDEITQVTTVINQKVNSGKKNIKYRNLLLYGPPGTGKTLFATELAKRSGMEYVFMSGSSFSKFKDGEGIEALDELFAWANKSKGLMIFIDEAETFLAKRENMDPQSKSYLLLNNFLNYTGTRSDKFMIVFATNHKDVLDSAMYRRIDDLVEVTLPGFAERIKLINVYVQKLLLDEKSNEPAQVKSALKVFTVEMVEKIARETKGLSGSEMEGIVNAIKTSADVANPAVIKASLVEHVVAQAVEKYFAFTNGKYTGTVID